MYRHLKWLRTGLLVSGIALTTLHSATASAAPVEPKTQRFALVIGSNATVNDQQAPLKYADDDAARMAELLREQGVVTELVTQFDLESQSLYPQLVKQARPVHRESLLAAHRAQVARMQRAAQTGAVEYLIYYSGHGDIGPDGQGYLTLAGQTTLTRHDLFSNLLATSPAQYNHIIVDACRSEAFVLSRGDRREWKPDRSEADYTQAVSDYLAKQHLGNFPQTGVVLASSIDQQTHEWARYRGGVFTHELLSGLRGAADINGDGEVEYSELGAFVSAANRGVKDPRARLRVVVRPPRSDERHALVDLGAPGSKRVLLFERGDTAKYSLEDGRGVRLADIRRSGDLPGYLRLPPGKIFIAREQAGKPQAAEGEIPADSDRVILASAIKFHNSTRQSRGALDVAFREGLFTVPYGYGYYSGYTDSQGMLAVEEPDWEVRIYKEVDGEMVEVADTTETPPAPKHHERDDDDDDDFEVVVDEWRPREVWSGLSVGTVFTTFATEDQIHLTDADQLIDTNQVRPWAGPLRGLDIRWHTFTIGRRKYPVWTAYFRTGYTRGEATFSPRQADEGFANGDAVAMNYYAVPLFFGCNGYLFNDFPVRPFGGLGFGFDIVHMQYARQGRDLLSDTRAKIGFELHAGIEARITNYFALRGEIQQLWSAKSRFDEVPNFRNTGFTVITSLAFNLPHRRHNKKLAEQRKRREERRARERARRKQQQEHIRVEIRRGDEKVVVDTKPPIKTVTPPPPVTPATTPVPAPGTPAPSQPLTPATGENL